MQNCFVFFSMCGKNIEKRIAGFKKLIEFLYKICAKNVVKTFARCNLICAENLSLKLQLFLEKSTIYLSFSHNWKQNEKKFRKLRKLSIPTWASPFEHTTPEHTPFPTWSHHPSPTWTHPSPTWKPHPPTLKPPKAVVLLSQLKTKWKKNLEPHLSIPFEHTPPEHTPPPTWSHHPSPTWTHPSPTWNPSPT